MTELPDAEDLNYWKTSQASSDTWLDKTERLITEYGGEVTRRATGREHGREALMVEFHFGADTFRAVWPVLPSREGNGSAARRQAATMLYHEVKARAVRFRIFGPRQAFFEYLVLPDGRPLAQLAAPEIADALPRLLPGRTS